MLVGNPVFPIGFQLEEVAALVEKILRKKNWKKFEKGEIKLVLIPFYLFYYDAAFEEENRLKKETEHGRLALNAETAELGRELADSMPEETQLAKELPDNYPLIVRKPIFSRQEAEKIALLKTASLVGTDRKNIVLTGFKMVYYPMWIAFATVAGKTSQLEISAVNGSVFGEENVPKREKGFVEITRETLEELKEPNAWLQYSKEIAQKTGERLAGRKETSEKHSILGRPSLWIIIALIIALIALVFL